MSVPVIGFFNNKGGVGKTSLVYHVAWMLRELGANVLAVDFDPQGNLTSAFVDEDDFEKIYEITEPEETAESIYGAVRPLVKGVGDLARVRVRAVDDHLGLICGDLRLSSFEDQLSESWPKCLGGDERAFRITSAFWRVIQQGARDAGAAFALVDLGPNLGSINRAALVACDSVVVPLAPDLFSLQGLRNLGPTILRWRKDWHQRLQEANTADIRIELPTGRMQPVGYVLQQPVLRLDRPVRAYAVWTERIRAEFDQQFGSKAGNSGMPLGSEPGCIGSLKNYRSLMPMALDARKPVFALKPADGALGGHSMAALDAYGHYRALTREIARRCGIPLPGVPG